MCAHLLNWIKIILTYKISQKKGATEVTQLVKTEVVDPIMLIKIIHYHNVSSVV